jgi:hypothetical protein
MLNKVEIRFAYLFVAIILALLSNNAHAYEVDTHAAISDASVSSINCHWGQV